MLKPGCYLQDVKQKWQAMVRVDGSLKIADETASIHKMGAKVQRVEACNGWTFWHYEENSKLLPIDVLRQNYRKVMLSAGLG